MTRWLPIVLGVVLVLVGGVWALQGAGVLPGSFMTGSRLWLVIGIAAVVVGGWLLWRGITARGRGSRSGS